MFFQEGHVFLEKKAPGRAAPHRRPDWGFTKPSISNPNQPFPIKIHQNIKSSDFGGRRHPISKKAKKKARTKRFGIVEKRKSNKKAKTKQKVNKRAIQKQ